MITLALKHSALGKCQRAHSAARCEGQHSDHMVVHQREAQRGQMYLPEREMVILLRRIEEMRSRTIVQ